MTDAKQVIVRDSGFSDDNWSGETIDLPADSDPDTLVQFVDSSAMIRIAFDSFADGRGFTLARRLRLAGFQGRLRAQGHVIADQYTMARRSGFDEVEISGELAKRQPEDQWLRRAGWQSHDYQFRLRHRA